MMKLDENQFKEFNSNNSKVNIQAVEERKKDEGEIDVVRDKYDGVEREVKRLTDELLSSKDYISFMQKTNEIRNRDDFELLLDALMGMEKERQKIRKFRESVKFVEVSKFDEGVREEKDERIIARIVDGIDSVKTETEYYEYLKRFRESDEFYQLLYLVTGDVKERVMGRLDEILGLGEKNLKNVILEKFDAIEEFDPRIEGLEIDEGQRRRGSFFEVWIPEEGEVVFKRLVKNRNEAEKFKYNREMCKYAFDLNKEYMGDFLLSENMIDLGDDLLFVSEKIKSSPMRFGDKGLKVDYKEGEIICLDLAMLKDKRKMKILLDIASFNNDFTKLIEASQKFIQGGKDYDGKLSVLPDFAGDNFVVIFDGDGKYEKIALVDSTGFLAENSDVYQPLKQLLDEYSSKISE